MKPASCPSMHSARSRSAADVGGGPHAGVERLAGGPENGGAAAALAWSGRHADPERTNVFGPKANSPAEVFLGSGSQVERIAMEPLR
jgi:hypothetical protein